MIDNSYGWDNPRYWQGIELFGEQQDPGRVDGAVWSSVGGKKNLTKFSEIKDHNTNQHSDVMHQNVVTYYALFQI